MLEYLFILAVIGWILNLIAMIAALISNVWLGFKTSKKAVLKCLAISCIPYLTSLGAFILYYDTKDNINEY